MRRVLLLAYHFPPIGGAGAQRSVQFARRLPELGWEPVVVTGPGESDGRWRPLDQTLEVDGVRILRVPGPEPARGGRAERWLRVPSPWVRWWRHGAVRLARMAGDVDLVHAPLAPYETAAGAFAVARALKRPLVLDLEDPWALDEMLVYPTEIHRLLDLARMRRVLGAADTVVMNTSEAAQLVRARRVTAIPNGFDPAEFAVPPARRNGVFRIVHTGSLHTELGLRHRRRGRMRRALGGATRGVDFLTRSHVHLLEAVARLGRDDVEVHLAGVLTEADREVAARYPFVRLHGFLSHPRTLQLVRSADLLFLPMHDLPAGRRARIVPCKTYEYLASGRPILAAVPEGDARDLLARSDATILCRPGDTTALAAAVERVLDQREGDGVLTPRPRPALLDRWAWPRLAADLAAVYERTLRARLAVTRLEPRAKVADPISDL